MISIRPSLNMLHHFRTEVSFITFPYFAVNYLQISIGETIFASESLLLYPTLCEIVKFVIHFKVSQMNTKRSELLVVSVRVVRIIQKVNDKAAVVVRELCGSPSRNALYF